MDKFIELIIGDLKVVVNVVVGSLAVCIVAGFMFGYLVVLGDHTKVTLIITVSILLFTWITIRAIDAKEE